MKKIQKFLYVFLIALLIIPVNYARASENEPLKIETEDLQMARLLFGGDVLPHINFDKHALAYGGGDYNYDRFFETLGDFTKARDLFVVNCEFTSNPKLEPSGFPMFNSNKAIYRSMKEIGVDVITTANNHCLDTGVEGIDYTIDAINSYGIYNAGTYKDGHNDPLIIRVNGINIGILSYASHINGLEYLLDTSEKKAKVDMIDPIAIKRDIEDILAKGAEFVVVYPHWGEEYSSYPSDYQIKLARAMIDFGADMVIGNHPHVIQPRELYKAIDGRDGIIYYSLGNLISNQNYAFFEGDQRVNQGLLVEAIIYKGGDQARAKLLNARYYDIWTDARYDEYGWLNRSYVTDEYLRGSKYDQADFNMLEGMRLAEEMNSSTINTTIEK